MPDEEKSIFHFEKHHAIYLCIYKKRNTIKSTKALIRFIP